MDRVLPPPTIIEIARTPLERKNHWSDRREQNLSLPISQIPFEILSEIYLLNTVPVHSSDFFSRQTTARWTSQVNHSWRTVALACPILWSRVIDFTCGAPKWTEELLARAGESPIDLYMRSRPLKAEMLARELQHFGRVRIFSLASSTEACSTVIDNICQPTPRLEQFTLHCMDFKAMLFLPPSVFWGCSPRLVRLDLRRCTVDFNLPIFQRLKILCVEDIVAHTAPSAAKWLDILGNMPLLVEVRLYSAMTSHIEEIHSTVHLPSLNTLHLSSSLPVSVAILYHLIHPVSTNIKIACSNTTTNIDFKSLLRILSRHMSFSNLESRNPCISLMIVGANIKVCNWVDDKYGEEEKTRVSVSLSWHKTDATWCSFIPALTSAFGSVFKDATTLEFEMGSNIVVFDSEKPILLGLLHMFGNVEQLDLYLGRRTLALLQVQGSGSLSTVSLSEDNGGEPQQNSQVIFPSLQRIKLRNRATRQLGLQLFEKLTSFLRYRSSVGANIAAVYVQGLWIDVNQVRLLKELGLQVFNHISDENEL